MAGSNRPSFISSSDSMPEMRRPRWSSIARLAPAVILASLLLDLSLRFVPPTRVAFRAWEAMTVFTPPMGAFPPNTRYDNQKSYGDLANLGNLPDFRQYRHEIFTTDFRGFRNLPQFESNSRPDILLVGDSFGAGAGGTDMDSPSVRLYAALHRKGYNAAGRPNDLDLALNLIHNLDFRGGMILWQLSERFDLPEGDLGVDVAPGHLAFLPAQARQQFRRLRSVVEQHARYSPYKILFTRFYRYLQNDRILANPQASNAFIAQLRDCSSMSIVRHEIQTA